MAFRSLLAALGAVCVLSAGAAQAQDPRPPLTAETAESRRTQYNEELRQLSSVLGGAHYLRILCVGRQDQSWRLFMTAMLDREGGARRRDLVDAFNAGYRDMELRFPACSPDAQTQETLLKNQGARIADTLRARHSD